MNVKDVPQIDLEIKECLKNWREMIAKYQKPDSRKAVIQVLNSFLPYIALWALMYYSLNWSIFITIGLGIINAFFLVRIFIIQHDCGHQSFFKSRKLNNFVGKVCSVFSFMPYSYWAKSHNYHHGHSGMLEVRDIGDIPMLTVEEYKERNWWGRLRYRIWRFPLVTFVIAPVYYFIVSTRYPTFKFNNWKKTTIMQIKDNIWIALGYIVLGFALGWAKFLIVQLMLVFFFGIISFWFFYVQHQHEMAYKEWKDNWDFLLSAIKGASYYKLPKMWQWLTGNIGIHHIHHLSSLIPNYNLEKCMVENKILSKYVTTIGFWDSLKTINNKLWDENQKKMISFSEFNRIEQL